MPVAQRALRAARVPALSLAFPARAEHREAASQDRFSSAGPGTQTPIVL